MSEILYKIVNDLLTCACVLTAVVMGTILIKSCGPDLEKVKQQTYQVCLQHHAVDECREIKP
jgi:hypothetical protein